MSISNLINGQATWSNIKINSASIKDDLLIPQYTVLPPPQNGLLISYNDGSGFQLWYSDGLAWAKVSGGTGSGDVVGPALATDSHIALYDGVSGKLIKNSPVEITPTSVNFFTLAPRSSNIPAVNTDLTNKLYVDTAISGISGGDVVGPASAKNGYLTTYDGVTGKLIKSDSTVASTNNRIQAFDAFGLPNILEINSDTDHLGSDITNVGTIAPDTVNTDLIASKSGSTVSFNNKPQSNAPPTVNDDLTNKLYVDNATSGLGDVSGPASAKNGYLTTYDGITGKLIKSDSTVASTNNRIQAFDAFGLPNILEINSDTDHLNSDISNVGDLGIDTITANTGSVITFNNKPQSSIAPTVNDDLTNKLYIDTQVGNFYAMLVDGPTVQVTGGTADPETSLLPSGVGDFDGTLTVPANRFKVGDSFHFVLAGQCIYDTDNFITLRLKNSGTLAELTMELENTDAPNTFWELEADFTIRSIGIAGTIVTNFDFSFNRRVDRDFRGQRNVSVSTINTTVINTLDITAEFTGMDDSSMFAQLGYLKKMH